MHEKKSYTRFEKTRILAARSLQIYQGSPTLVTVPPGMLEPYLIANLEWDAEVIPIDIMASKDGIVADDAAAAVKLSEGKKK